ncbi:MAG: nucleotidyltransferase family protein [Sphingobacteriales bacterium]|nr:nucleotidyltransferase family protein [Sphingobacteriales bacterium]
MRDLASIKTALEQLKPEMERRFHVKSIGIFGSAVRNDFKPESDIDLIVDFSEPIGISFIDLADYIEQKMKARIDLVSRNGIKPQYFTLIKNEIVYV